MNENPKQVSRYSPTGFLTNSTIIMGSFLIPDWLFASQQELFREGDQVNKYRNKKVMFDGQMFDSQLEAKFYAELVLRKKAKDILDFERQPSFILQHGFSWAGHKERPITYRADFAIKHNDLTIEVVDCKGMKTETYKIKRKLFLLKYCVNSNYKFTEITKEDMR